MKHNPGLLGEEALVAGFVARERELADLVEVVRENTGPANQHVLLIGPRGSGKTTLALRVAAAVRGDPELARAVYPLVFAEEAYEVHSAGSLWLEALDHLGRQTGARRWREAYAQLRGETDPVRLRTLALGELRDFCEDEGKRLLVIVENLGPLIDRQLDEAEAWALRHTLQTEPRIMLLATATSRFDGIDRSDQALFDLFRTFTLEPLGAAACAALWQRITGRAVEELRGRALEILTGGNPRLLTLLAEVAADAPLDALADDLTRLIDEQTPYFKSNIDALAPQEQRVFAALAALWAASTAREVAERTRLPVNTVSAVLARLESAGIVTAIEISPRRKRYQLAERLYNLYYALRRRGGAEERVRFVVDFIAAYYEPEALVDRLVALAEQTLTASAAERPARLHAFFGLYERLARSHGGLIHPRLPAAFLGLPELSAERRAQLAADGERARSDTAWFFELCQAVCEEHRVLREFVAAARTSPELRRCGDALVAVMRGEAPVQALRQLLEERSAQIFRALRKLSSRLRRSCRAALAAEPSWIDVVASATLGFFWFDDEGLIEGALAAAAKRWPASPWPRLFLALEDEPVRTAVALAAVVDAHPTDPWLPIGAGVILEIEERPELAAQFYRSSPIVARLVELARALAEIREEALDLERPILTEPGSSYLAFLLERSMWPHVYAWLGRCAARVGRWSDAAAILEVAREIGAWSPSLRLLYGLALQRCGRVEEGHEVWRRVFEEAVEDWRVEVAIAGARVALGEPDAALAAFTRSWRGFCAGAASEAGLHERVEAWLAPMVESLPGHQLPRGFAAMLRAEPAALRAELDRLLAAPLRSREDRQRVIGAALALALRAPQEALQRLRAAPAAASVEPLIVGLARFLGEEVRAPPEVSDVAADIAGNLRLASGLYTLVRGGGT